jgi:hypothetical protein
MLLFSAQGKPKTVFVSYKSGHFETLVYRSATSLPQQETMYHGRTGEVG